MIDWCSKPNRKVENREGLFLLCLYGYTIYLYTPFLAPGFYSWFVKKKVWSSFHTSRFDKTVDGNCWLLTWPNHSGWLLPCRLSQFRNAKTKRSACVGVKVSCVYCLLISPAPSLVSARNIFSWPWRTIMSPSYTLFEVQCSNHLGTTWDIHEPKVSAQVRCKQRLAPVPYPTINHMQVAKLSLNIPFANKKQNLILLHSAIWPSMTAGLQEKKKLEGLKPGKSMSTKLSVI